MDEMQNAVLVEVRNRVGHLSLNRAHALNALNLEMTRCLYRQLQAWERDPEIVAVVIRSASDRVFCAGGDIRMLYHSYHAKDNLHEVFFREEYVLDQYLRNYPKPVLALVDGLVLGGGMGVVQSASLRIVTERARMGMPEVSIGFFPDVGGSYFLSHLPGRLGEYLGVTGQQVGAADALYVGLADYGIPSARLDELDSALDTRQWREPARQTLTALLEKLAVNDIAGGVLPLHRQSIDECFSKPDLNAICTALKHDDAADWAAQTLTLIETRSPLAMGITLELLRRGRMLEVTDCFALEFHLAMQLFDHGEFVEGVRALVIDKDKTPRWNPASIAQLDSASVQRFFKGFPA